MKLIHIKRRFAARDCTRLTNYQKTAPSAFPWRIGQGYDIHVLVPDRPLMLGGVQVPHTHGLHGHSDADVLLHAITDALLGAAALGDIGQHFPDTDARFAGADSRVLLRRTVRLIRAAGYHVVNVDSTILAQTPKLSSYLSRMAENIAEDLHIARDCVNIKAKTNEGVGSVGRQEAISAQVVVLLAAGKA